MEAVVTIKGTPAEFDLIRRALESHEKRMRDVQVETAVSQEVRDARAEVLRTTDLLGKLR